MISIWKLGLVFLIALIVLGPETLARLAYQAGRVLRHGRNLAAQYQQSLQTLTKKDESPPSESSEPKS
ncbi:MAG: twin-arginine translocase TatA/TatE family subunit [Gammaproteobacteria bacterium]